MAAKGVELPTNAIIVLSLGLIVMVLFVFFSGKNVSNVDAMQAKNAFEQGCQQLKTLYQCDSTKLSQVKTSYTVDGQQKNLLEVCHIAFSDPFMSGIKCKNACLACGKKVYDGSPCEDDSDCQSPTTQGWSCDGAKKCIPASVSGSRVSVPDCRQSVNCPSSCTKGCKLDAARTGCECN
ncbi:MAG: hypothetical protein JW727_02065 [Candidatus Aenigmarchaeota archaeon]|nr:hypothetical protein [Candidatus Aenigmarchaeota archaeon]